MTQSDQLSQLVATFEQWRNTRLGTNKLTPKSLRQQAVLLQETYPRGKITKALRISGTQLKQWAEQCQHDEDGSPVFVPLPQISPQHLSPRPVNNNVNLVLNFVQGQQLHLSGKISPELITSLIKAVQS